MSISGSMLGGSEGVYMILVSVKAVAMFNCLSLYLPMRNPLSVT